MHTPALFLVCACGSASIGWTLDLSSKRLRSLASALAPAYLRVGGSNADLAVYGAGFLDGGETCPPDVLAKRACLSPARWDELLDFVRATGLSLVFTLNIMKTRAGGPAGGPFNASNARALLAYTARRHPKGVASWLAFELGNEKEFVLSPAETAARFLEVRGLLDALWPRPSDRPRLVGPAMNPRPDWLTQFLTAMPARTLDAVSYHLYPGYGRSLDLPARMLEPGWLDFSHRVMRVTQRAVQAAADRGSGPELWIGETAAAWASGTAGVCDGFVSGFWWLDQLSQAAATGHDAMCRQCLVGGNYSLLDQLAGLRPNPDYWSAWLWRQLVGTRILALTQVMPYMGDFEPATRGYLACTRPGAPGFRPGAVTLIYINQDSAHANRTLIMTTEPRLQTHLPAAAPENALPLLPPPFPSLPRLEFVLSPGENGSILSRDIRLNGKTLSLGPDGSLPSLEGRPGVQPGFVVPARSYGFAVYPEADAPACLR